MSRSHSPPNPPAGRCSPFSFLRPRAKPPHAPYISATIRSILSFLGSLFVLFFQIQDMIATGTLVKRGGDDGGRGGGAWPLAGRPSSGMSRHDSEDVLGSLLVEGMPDRAAAANLENVPEGEVMSLASRQEQLATSRE